MSQRLKQIAVLILVVALFALALSVGVGADSSGLCFTAINDRVLETYMMPVFSNGTPYIRADFFKTYLDFSYAYFQSNNTAVLSGGSIYLKFDLTNGVCEDGSGNTVPIDAQLMNGTLYLPAYAARYYGLGCSYIDGTGYGDLVRITNGSQYLDDASFKSAAESTIYSRYLEYYGGSPPQVSTAPTPSPSPSPELKGGAVRLSFAGLPTAEMLDTLKEYSSLAAFFVTAREAESGADILRRIVGEGHTLGIYCETSPEKDWEAAADAISRAAFYLPTIVTSSAPEDADGLNWAREQGLVFYSPSQVLTEEESNAYDFIALLPTDGQASDFLLPIGEKTTVQLSIVLSYFEANGFIAEPLLETTAREVKV
jgi:hypothetical protein